MVSFDATFTQSPIINKLETISNVMTTNFKVISLPALTSKAKIMVSTQIGSSVYCILKFRIYNENFTDFGCENIIVNATSLAYLRLMDVLILENNKFLIIY